MTEVIVSIPSELESEFKLMPKINLTILVSEILKEKLLRIARFKQIVSRSQLTEEQATGLADEISESLSKKYDALLHKI